MAESTLFPEVFRDDALEEQDLQDQTTQKQVDFDRQQEELLRRQAEMAGPREVAQPERPAGLAVDQPVEEEPRFVSEALRATVGGVVGEIRDIIVNVDRLTDAALTGLGILEEDEKEGILGLQDLLPDVDDPESTVGKIVRGLVEFGTGFLLFGAAGRALKITNRAFRAAAAGAAQAGFGRGEDEEGRLTDLVTQMAPSLENDRIVGGLVRFLQTSDDETALETFGKDVVEDVLLGLGVDTAVFIGRRLVEGLRPGVIRQTLADQGGAVGPRGGAEPGPGAIQGPEQAPIQGPTEAALQGPEPFPGARTPQELFDQLPTPVLRPDDPTGIGAAIENVENAGPQTFARIEDQIGSIFSGEGKPLVDPPLLARPEEGGYSREAVAKIAGTDDIHDPLFRHVANFTVTKGDEIRGAAQDALDNGFNITNRTAAYTGIQEMLQGYQKLESTIKQGRDVVTAQTGRDLGKPSRWTRQLMERLQETTTGVDEAAFFKGLAENPSKVVQNLAIGQRNFFQLTKDLLNELFYSSALSAPGTLIRAALGAPILFGYETAAKVVGGVVTGNRSGLLGEAAADVAGAYGALWDGIKLFGVTLGEDNVSRAALAIRGVEETPVAISGEAFGFTGRMGKALDVVGKTIRFPTTTLGAIDAGTELIVKRMVAHREAYRRGVRGALETGPGDAAKVAHRDAYVGALDTNFTQEIERIGKNEARRLMLTSELQPGTLQNFNDLINKNAFLKILVPFVRVSSNAMIASVEKTPVLAFIQKRQREILRSGSKVDKDILAGQQVLGAGVMSAAAMLTINGFMTGASPQNPTVREAWNLQGRKEYSFNFMKPNGDVVNFQYAKLGEPIGFLLGAVADLTHGIAHIQDNLIEADNAPDVTVYTEAAEVLGLAFAQNIAKRTFMQSVVDVSQAVTDPARFLSKFAAETATTVAIPLGGLLRQIDRQANPELPEVATFMDRVYSRVPFFNADLPPKRNLFGEPMEFSAGFGAAFINPELVFGIPKGLGNIFSPVVMTGVDPDDPAVQIGNVIRENRLVPEGARAPSSFRGIKFTPEEQDFAAKRRGEIEIGGQTLKEALFELIQDPVFQDANPGKDGVQEALISRTIQLYNQAAVFETVDQFGDIFDRVEARLDRIRPQ